MKKYAVIVAGGSGTRMGGATPKQFLLVNNKPVLYYSLQTFLNAFADIQIILVLPVDYTDMGQEIIDAYFDKVMLVQTPQTFHSKILLPAFKIDYKEKFTDEATVVEAYGLKVTLVEGEENNIKITKPMDLLIAEKIINERD